MLNRWSVVLLLLGILIGYSLPQRAVNAQAGGQAPNIVGERVIFFGDAGTPLMGGGDCTVVMTHANFIGCGRAGAVEEWWNTDRVMRVMRQRR